MSSAQRYINEVSKKGYRERDSSGAYTKSSGEPAQSFIPSRPNKLKFIKPSIYEKAQRATPGVNNFFNTMATGFVNQRKRALYYGQGVRRPVIGSGMKKPNGGRGRPRGSYDQRYAQYGGVYGYRKFVTQQNQLARIEAMRRNAVTPQQEMIIRQMEARRREQQLSPEQRVIPDTYGRVPTKSVHQEIDDYSNLVP